MGLNGSTTIITGGTGALGQVVARQFLEQGSNVASSYLAEDELQRLPEEFRRKVFVVRADVSKDEDVTALFQRVIAKFGRVDILINLVGGFLPGRNIRELKSADWDKMMSMNLKTAFLCTREFLQKLGDATYGRIISMAAMAALRPSAGRAPYAVSKGGIVTLTQTLAEELKGTGITANAIAPSIIKTRANAESMPDADSSKWVTPEEIADLMLMLCSEKGRSINGACIPVFGGI